MAKPDLRKLYADSEGQIIQQMGVGVQPLEPIEGIERLILKRIGGLFKANTLLDLTDPGPGWDVFGNITGIEDEIDLFLNTKIYRNGQLLAVNDRFSPNFDFSFMETNTVAFIFSVRKGEVLQIIRNFKD